MVTNTPPAYQQFEIGWGHNFVYLILDWQTKAAAIVDPQSDLVEPLTFLQKNGFELIAILLTHSHSDHTAGIQSLLKVYPEMPVYLHPGDAFRLTKTKTHALEDHEQLKVGGLAVKVLHTPGHSRGAVCFYFQNYLISGDTLFLGTCGRTDLETGNNEEMFHSLQNLKKLPPETIILPGHHYSPPSIATLAEELKTNPVLTCPSLDEFLKLS